MHAVGRAGRGSAMCLLRSSSETVMDYDAACNCGRWHVTGECHACTRFGLFGVDSAKPAGHITRQFEGKLERGDLSLQVMCTRSPKARITLHFAWHAQLGQVPVVLCGLCLAAMGASSLALVKLHTVMLPQ